MTHDSVSSRVSSRSRRYRRLLAVAALPAILLLLPAETQAASGAAAQVQATADLATAATASAPAASRGHGSRGHGSRGSYGRGHSGRGHYSHGRGHHGHGRYGYRHSGHRRSHFSIGFGYGHGYGYRYPYYRYSHYRHPYYGYGYGHGYGHRYYPYRYGYYGTREGAVDLNVKPKKAEVYLNGNYVGTVDQFDGYPGYLWLEKGTYELEIYKEGYQTFKREIAAFPNVVIRIDERLRPGEAVRPEPRAMPEPDYAPEGDYTPRPDYAPAPDDAPRSDRAPRKSPPSEAPARLVVAVQPDDAAVYLDGHFLGAAADLRGMSAGLLITPGEHTLEVVRPGYASATRKIDVDPGERVELALGLDRR